MLTLAVKSGYFSYIGLLDGLNQPGHSTLITLIMVFLATALLLTGCFVGVFGGDFIYCSFPVHIKQSDNSPLTSIINNAFQHYFYLGGFIFVITLETDVLWFLFFGGGGILWSADNSGFFLWLSGLRCQPQGSVTSS